MSQQRNSRPDPLKYSNRTSLPFTDCADDRLGSTRNSRYDDSLLNFAGAELQIREFASIMGMVGSDDDYPTAA
jgi:hypothetical protein